MRSVKNDECFSTSTISSTVSNGQRNGTCFTTQECMDRQGSASGSCAAGFGVCCVFLASTCGSTVKENCTYVRNPGFPASTSGLATCTYNILKSDPEVCTLRLDFESFNLLAGSTTIEGDPGFGCQDEFNVNGLGTAQRIPIICGSNNGQHIYVDLGNLPGDMATLSFTFGANSIGNRIWEIKVLQIESTSLSKPPPGCLQYLFGSEGTLQTFNFASGNGHLLDQDYSICIRQETGFCCIRFEPCPTSDSWSLDTNGVIGTGKSNVDSSCTGDFIEIEGSSSICNLLNSVNRYCGSVLSDNNFATGDNLPVCDCTTPFIVRIRTDNQADAINTRISRGVCLRYHEVPCGSRHVQ